MKILAIVASLRSFASARLADELFEYLDAPVRRVAAKDVFVAYQPKLEDVILPQSEDIERAMLELAEF